ncbi:MAG: hypothetical protein KatS3mg082_0128 [Nitrospiraceae bacterium]|nr:MAG: hypothetical protein KatS3mg082_0128 [Nitrospiraceae bacterium]
MPCCACSRSNTKRLPVKPGRSVFAEDHRGLQSSVRAWACVRAVSMSGVCALLLFSPCCSLSRRSSLPGYDIGPRVPWRKAYVSGEDCWVRCSSSATLFASGDAADSPEKSKSRRSIRWEGSTLASAAKRLSSQPGNRCSHSRSIVLTCLRFKSSCEPQRSQGMMGNRRNWGVPSQNLLPSHRPVGGSRGGVRPSNGASAAWP